VRATRRRAQTFRCTAADTAAAAAQAEEEEEEEVVVAGMLATRGHLGQARPKLKP